MTSISTTTISLYDGAINFISKMPWPVEQDKKPGEVQWVPFFVYLGEAYKDTLMDEKVPFLGKVVCSTFGGALYGYLSDEIQRVNKFSTNFYQMHGLIEPDHVKMKKEQALALEKRVGLNIHTSMGVITAIRGIIFCDALSFSVGCVVLYLSYKNSMTEEEKKLLNEFNKAKTSLESINTNLSLEISKVRNDGEALKTQINTLKAQIVQLEEMKKAQENQIKLLKDVIEQLQESFPKKIIAACKEGLASSGIELEEKVEKELQRRIKVIKASETMVVESILLQCEKAFEISGEKLSEKIKESVEGIVTAAKDEMGKLREAIEKSSSQQETLSSLLKQNISEMKKLEKTEVNHE